MQKENVQGSRRRPQQARARKTVARILTAAQEIVRRKGLAGLTTNHVAVDAGVSIGSLYQYFPNKNAILIALFEEAYGKLRASFEALCDDPEFPRDLDAFLNAHGDRVAEAEQHFFSDLEVISAMRSHPDIIPIEEQHAEYVADWNAQMLKRLGSNWPIERLKKLTLVAYYMDEGIWPYVLNVGSMDEDTNTWRVRAYRSLLSQALDFS